MKIPKTAFATKPGGVLGPKVPIDFTLKTAVAGFEKLGGQGQWFASTNPFGGSRQGFYLITELPGRAAPHAKLFALREETARQQLNNVLKTGAPVVLGTMPEAIYGAAIGKEYAVAGDALAKSRSAKQHQNILLIQPAADKFTVAHEFQHWKYQLSIFPLLAKLPSRSSAKKFADVMATYDFSKDPKNPVRFSTFTQ